MKLAIALVPIVVLSVAAGAQPYDDAAIMRQMGFVAGQAVAHGLDQQLIASAVTARLLDGVGYDDEASRGLLPLGIFGSHSKLSPKYSLFIPRPPDRTHAAQHARPWLTS